MPRASRDKGKRGEAEVHGIFEAGGYRVQASQRNLGGSQGDATVITPRHLLHVECKRSERLNVWEALAQAEAECGQLVPVVCFRRNRAVWYAVTRLDDFVKVLA